MEHLRVLLGDRVVAELTLEQPRGLPQRVRNTIYSYVYREHLFQEWTVKDINLGTSDNLVDQGKLRDCLKRLTIRKYEHERQVRLLHTAPLRDLLWEGRQVGLSIVHGKIKADVPTIEIYGDGAFLCKWSYDVKVEIHPQTTTGGAHLDDIQM